jgi:hemerythrin-like domain-containing protein
MKRSAALAPLSRDHHSALVLARALSRVRAEDREALAERFVAFLSEHELRHFDVEEALLGPVIPGDEPGPSLRQTMLEDHAFFRAALSRLRDDPGQADVEFLRDIGARLRSHVQMEERELFPLLETTLDSASLDAIGARLHSH